MRLLGIDLGDREVRVARAERWLGAVRLTSIERIPFGDAAALSAGLALLAAARAGTVLTALPAAAATHRILVLPFRDRRRLARTVPLELAGHLAPDVGREAIAFVPLGRVEGGTAVMAAAVRRAELAVHVARLTDAGLAPARVDLAPLPVWNLVPPERGDAALLLADGARCSVSVRRAGRLAGLRALSEPASAPAALAAEARWSLAALDGAPETLLVTGADADPSLGAALAAALGRPVVPLAGVAALPGCDARDLEACAVAAGLVAGAARRAPVGLAFGGIDPAPAGAFRRIGALAGLALALGMIDLALYRHALARRDAALRAAIRAEAAAALPGARLVAPRVELEAAVAALARRQARLGGDDGALTVLRELSTRLPRALRLDLDEVAIEPDALRLHGRAESFDAVEVLRRALAASPMLADVAADETRTTVDGRQVEFRLEAARRVPGETS